MLSIILRPLLRKNDKIVVLYGHKLNGNLRAIAEYSQMRNEYQLYFATLDPSYYKKLNKTGAPVPCLSLLKFSDVLIVARAKVIIADRIAHALVYYLKLTSIKFVDVWHGVPFKGFYARTFRLMRSYQQIWVSSPSLRNIYIHKFGLTPRRIKVTGYARVDRFVTHAFSRADICRRYGISATKKIILLAPTWQHDAAPRREAPFSVAPQIFFQTLNEAAERLDALVIFRSHLNAKDKFTVNSLPNVLPMPHSEFPQSEEFLAIADILISDWSSIVFDYLPLHRPTIFLNTPPPFNDGFTVDKRYRYGEIVSTLEELVQTLQRYTLSPERYVTEHEKDILDAEDYVFGDTLDGRATERNYACLGELM